jgi:hypothetical protein
MATLSTRIRMVLGSNIGWVTTVLIEVSRGFPQSPQASTGIVPRLCHNYLLPDTFQFIIHQILHHLTLYSPDTDSVVKK